MTTRYTAVISRRKEGPSLHIYLPLSDVVTGPKWLPAPSNEIGQLMTDHWPSHGRCTRICIIW